MSDEPNRWESQGDHPWPRNTPDVRVNGLTLVDSVMTPVGTGHSDEDGDEDDSSDAPPFDFNWNIYAVRFVDDPYTVGMIGELFICSGSWHLTAAAVCPLQMRGRLAKENAALDLKAQSERWGPWINHTLWDFVSQHARILAAGTLAQVPLPVATPPAVFMRSEGE